MHFESHFESHFDRKLKASGELHPQIPLPSFSFQEKLQFLLTFLHLLNSTSFHNKYECEHALEPCRYLFHVIASNIAP